MEIEENNLSGTGNRTNKEIEKIRKYRIIVMKYDGYSLRDIENKISVNRGTISKIIRKFEKYGDVESHYETSGRKTKLTPNTKEIINTTLTENPYANLKEIHQKLEEEGKNVSIPTINRHEHTIGSFKQAYLHTILSQTNKEKRVAYCKQHLTNNFHNTLFTDECKFELNRNTQKVFVFKGNKPPIKAKLNPNYTQGIGGAINRKGKLALYFYDGYLTGEKYLNILKQFLPSTMDSICSDEEGYFQQDNAPCHTAKIVQEGINQNINFYPFPPQSPDLNPIEMVWAGMKDRVEKKPEE